MLFRILILFHACVAFPFKCPEPAQWSLRARSHCPDPSKYCCLKNDLINGYSENCTVFDFLQPGRKHVLRGGLDADICSSERYQPWPITFYTNVSTNCIFLKSLCKEEGQVVNENGNRNTDTTCKCDYTKGYDFLVKPRNPCFCVPLEEDCSCYLKTCMDSTFEISPDYECIDSRINISMTNCIPMMNGRDKNDKIRSQTQHISSKDNISSPVLWKILAWMSTFVVCIGLLFVFCGNALLEKYYRTAYFIIKPADDITILEGQSVSLEYKLLVNRFPIEYKRNNISIGEANHISKIDAGRTKKLKITHIALTDDGEYCLEAADIKSKPTRLIVKPLFKRTLKDITSVEGSSAIFECETEKENGTIEWFKDGVKITTNTEKQETEQGYIYKLTIEQSVKDSGGTYRVKKNGIHSEAKLEVKALFKRPLPDLKTEEGFPTTFECETEEDSSPVEWFKGDNKISNDIKNTKMEIIRGHIHRLTIYNTSLEDSGKYRISKKGICSESVLYVQDKYGNLFVN